MSTSSIPIDPDDPPVAAIRELLTSAFTAETLRRFCVDRPQFRPVIGSFGPGHGFGRGQRRDVVVNLLLDIPSPAPDLAA